MSFLHLYTLLCPLWFKKMFPARLRLSLLWMYSWVIALASRSRFSNVQSYCLFLGYPRTGHTLLNALLNAHEHIVLSNELRDLRYAKQGFSRLQLFAMEERNARLFHTVKKSFHTGYSYKIINSWQGKYSSIKVIGNKDAQYVSRMLMTDPGAVDHLARVVAIPLKIIHVTRHPLDTIATMAIKSVLVNPGRITPSEGIINAAIELYFQYVNTVVSFKASNSYPMLDLWHEDFVSSPRANLALILDFLEVTYNEAFIEKACSIVFDNPNLSRTKISWTPSQLDMVKRRSLECHYLRHYFE